MVSRLIELKIYNLIILIQLTNIPKQLCVWCRCFFHSLLKYTSLVYVKLTNINNKNWHDKQHIRRHLGNVWKLSLWQLTERIAHWTFAEFTSFVDDMPNQSILNSKFSAIIENIQFWFSSVDITELVESSSANGDQILANDSASSYVMWNLATFGRTEMHECAEARQPLVSIVVLVAFAVAVF